MHCSSGNSVLSEWEVGGFLGSSGGLNVLLELGETGSLGLGGLGSEILWGELLLLPLILGGTSSLLGQNGEDLGDGLSDNLYKKEKSRGYSPLATHFNKL